MDKVDRTHSSWKRWENASQWLAMALAALGTPWLIMMALALISGQFFEVLIDGGGMVGWTAIVLTLFCIYWLAATVAETKHIDYIQAVASRQSGGRNAQT